MSRTAQFCTDAIFCSVVLATLFISSCSNQVKAANNSEYVEKESNAEHQFVTTQIKPWGKYRFLAPIGNMEAYVTKIYSDGWVAIRTRKKSSYDEYVNLDNVLKISVINPPPIKMPTSLRKKLQKASKYARNNNPEKLANILAPEQLHDKLLKWFRKVSDSRMAQFSSQFATASTLGVEYRTQKRTHLRLYDPLDILDNYDEDLDRFIKAKNGEWYPDL